MNFTSGNLNNNNKANSYVARPVSALGEKEKEEWLEAFGDCCRHKMTSEGCIAYRMGYEADLWRLGAEVKSGTYRPSTSVCFCVTRPKLHEVFAANFRDRIVHHWLMLKLGPLFEERFRRQGDVSFNCRKGFGTLAAARRVQEDTIAVTGGFTRSAWYGRFDFSGFFMSVDKEILLQKLKPFVYGKYKGEDIGTVWRTLEAVIRHNPATDCVRKGDVALFGQLPPHKSLFHVQDGKGMPIGNLTSQTLANFYLSFLDGAMVRFCKERGGRYVRFVDDFLVILPTAKDVTEAYRLAERVARDELALTLHKDKVYVQHCTKGVRFVGYVAKRGRLYLSNRTYGGLANAMRRANRLARHQPTDKRKLSREAARINSYIGFTVHVNGYARRLKLLLAERDVYRHAYLKGRNHTFKLKQQAS